MRRFYLFFLVLLFLAGLLGVVSLRSFKYQNPSTVTLYFESGTSFKKISNTLERNGIIPSALIFEVVARVTGKASKVMAGEYEFSVGLRPMSVLNKMVRGDVKKYVLTIPEGWTLKDIGNLFIQKGIVSSWDEWQKILTDPKTIKSILDDPKSKDDLQGYDGDIPILANQSTPSLEGYLFPATYSYSSYAQAAGGRSLAVSLLINMREKFELVVRDQLEVSDSEIVINVVRDNLEREAHSQGWTTHQWVTLASIIEKETGKAHERPLIASVFLNRLKANMPLQTDPTVIYGIPNFNGNLTRKDLQTDHPYNTYTRMGLPPGPICSPGKDSLIAVLRPAKTDYYYFVGKGDGSHYFSRTLDEHNQAVRKYQLGQK